VLQILKDCFSLTLEDYLKTKQFWEGDHNHPAVP